MITDFANYVPPVITKVNKFWELLETTGLVETHRAKVPGGWLVQQTFVAPKNRDDTKLANITFVSDPNHTWKMHNEFK